MKFIKKRDGRRVKFDKTKIQNAVESAFNSVDGELTEYAEEKALNIANFIETEVLNNTKEMISVEDIQDMVENGLMSTKRKDVAREYIKYRHDRDLVRSHTDREILDLVGGNNEDWATENTNKNAKLITTQRDYIAGIVSKDIANRYIIPKDVQEAENLGAIYVHDKDYLAEATRTNCCLVNLEDMLQNGTVLNGKMIEKPHRLTTATNIATQIIVAVSSSQYGGVSVTLSHLAPFVNDSRHKFIKKYQEASVPQELIDKLVEIDVKREIKDAIQIFNYQVNSMSSTNGQSPFITLFMYLGEAKSEQERDDLALLIEEVLKQRIDGIKNECGVPVTIAFPKLIMCLDKYIMDENSKYHYLKRLSVKCTNLRLCPDYVSEKIMLENKGDVYPPMGKTIYSPFKTYMNHIESVGVLR